MERYLRYDTLLPGPDDQNTSGRRLNGPKRNTQNDADYKHYCELYKKYVMCREPFLGKRDCVPIPQATGKFLIPAVERLKEERKINPLREDSLRPAGTPTRKSQWDAWVATLPAEYVLAWAELEQAIEELSDCHYVHNFGGPEHTRSVWLYDYDTVGTNTDAVQDVTFARRMLPTPGGPEVANVLLQTQYFDDDGVNYVPERGLITGDDEAGVSQGVEPPAKRGRGEAYELCMSISKHPDTAQKYASLLWAAVFQDVPLAGTLQ